MVHALDRGTDGVPVETVTDAAEPLAAGYTLLGESSASTQNGHFRGMTNGSNMEHGGGNGLHHHEDAVDWSGADSSGSASDAEDGWVPLDVVRSHGTSQPPPHSLDRAATSVMPTVPVMHNSSAGEATAQLPLHAGTAAGPNSGPRPGDTMRRRNAAHVGRLSEQFEHEGPPQGSSLLWAAFQSSSLLDGTQGSGNGSAEGVRAAEGAAEGGAGISPMAAMLPRNQSSVTSDMPADIPSGSHLHGNGQLHHHPQRRGGTVSAVNTTTRPEPDAAGSLSDTFLASPEATVNDAIPGTTPAGGAISGAPRGAEVTPGQQLLGGLDPALFEGIELLSIHPGALVNQAQPPTGAPAPAVEPPLLPAATPEERGSAIDMSTETRTAILGAMKNFSLAYTPPWATQVSDDALRDLLSRR